MTAHAVIGREHNRGGLRAERLDERVDGLGKNLGLIAQ